MHRPVEGFPRLRFPNAHDVAGTAGGRGEQARLIADRARSLGSAAVNAEIIRHGFISNTEVPVLVSAGFACGTNRRSIRVVAGGNRS